MNKVLFFVLFLLVFINALLFWQSHRENNQSAKNNGSWPAKTMVLPGTLLTVN
ncbi:hypothetical protein [Flavisolibacter nicotianae]|uniref:hypothetical protein n=1 Tax=Flavisolibacter nicotianae TaxID=2364882 RepID=UPI0013C41164|nr:hypothetical protein [Flavisolibacter nicotianae]